MYFVFGTTVLTRKTVVETCRRAQWAWEDCISTSGSRHSSPRWHILKFLTNSKS